MYTNSDITVYNIFYDKDLRKDVYKRTVIKDVFYEARLGVNRVAMGSEQADAVQIFIPYRSLEGYTSPKDYVASINTFTLKLGDRVVKNAITYEIKDKLSELDEQFDTFTIHSVDIKDFGSKTMRHIELSCN